MGLYKLKLALGTLIAVGMLGVAPTAVAGDADAGPDSPDSDFDAGLPPKPPPPPVPTECQTLDRRIAKRKAFLAIRAQERIHNPTNPTFSPFCEANPQDEDCQLPGQNQDQRDLSRDISLDQRESNGDSPVYDPILLPLERRRRELHCPAPGYVPPPAR